MNYVVIPALISLLILLTTTPIQANSFTLDTNIVPVAFETEEDGGTEEDEGGSESEPTITD